MCPRGTYQLCHTTEECLSYDQFCDNAQDCSDNSDEAFTNGYCICSGVLCGKTCVPINKVCDSTWDCLNGEDEMECTRCRPNLHNTRSLLDQTLYVISLIKSTYADLDSFQIYFGALARQWVSLFGDDTSPFHIDVQSHDPEAQKVVHKAQQFLISIVSLRTPLRQFMSVMRELGLTTTHLPPYPHSATLNEEDFLKRWIVERTDINDELYEDLTERIDYLRQKATDSIEVLSAVTKTLHFDFATCQDNAFLTHENGMSKRSMREVFTALTLVQNNVPREQVNMVIDKLYSLNEQLEQLVVSVQNFDHIITTVAFMIDDVRGRLEGMISQVDVAASMLGQNKQHSKPTALEEPNAKKIKTARDYKMFRIERSKRHRHDIELQ